MDNRKSDAKADPTGTLYVGFCQVCDDDVVFTSESENLFSCPVCRSRMRLRSDARLLTTQA